MRIAVDAMGGDRAPEVVVEGAVCAARELGIPVTLVGDTEHILPHLPEDFEKLGIHLKHATQKIEMDEPPVPAIRRKRDSSIGVCMRLMKEGEVEACVTAGNTGAAAALAQMVLKRIRGIDRPAIATVLPTVKDNVLLLDSGANIECRPQNLLEFAIMGVAYARSVLGKQNPRVGLLSIGTESIKGNELTRGAFELLSRAPVNFSGNVEGRDIGLGVVDVVVCDGFVGNIVLKVAEGYGIALMRMLKTYMNADLKSRIGVFFLRKSLQKMKKQVDYAESGGALLLGVNGICVIGHGSSNAYAVRNAIRLAHRSVEDQVVDRIRDSVGEPI